MLPVSLLRRLIPRGLLIPNDVVVGLAVVGAIVARVAQVLRKELYMFRQPNPGTHVIGAQSDRPHSGNDSSAAGGADSVAGKGMSKQSAFRRQLIHMRRHCLRVSVTSKVRTDVFTADPKNIGAVLCSGSRRQY